MTYIKTNKYTKLNYTHKGARVYLVDFNETWYTREMKNIWRNMEL